MLSLNYFNILKQNLSGGLDIDRIKNFKTKEIIDSIYIKKNHHMLGWVDLIDYDKKLIKNIQKTADFVQKNYDNFVVLGIGGSALGTKAVVDAFENDNKFKKKCNVMVLDNIDESTFSNQLKKTDLSKTMFNVISKSGSTSETLIQMMIVLKMLDEKKLKYSEHIIITTETDNELHKFAKDFYITTFEVPKNVGGRFSVFSPVGLLPVCVFGVDIVKLLKGANSIKKQSRNENIFDNIAMLMAYINVEMYYADKDELVLFCYSDSLNFAADYFLQIWAESLGKTTVENGKTKQVGQTAIKAIGVTDQHSQLQLYSEGKNNKLFMFIGVEENDRKLSAKSKMPKFDFLSNVAMGKLFNIERDATTYALLKNGRPNYSLNLKSIDEKTLGAVLYLFQIATAFAGVMLKVDAYDQPGVEKGKIYTKALLGDEKYIKEKQEIENHLKNSSTYTVSV